MNHTTHSFSPQFFHIGRRLSLDGTFAYTRLGEYRKNLRAKGPMDDEVGSANLQLCGVGRTASRLDPGRPSSISSRPPGPISTSWTIGG